MAPRHPQPAQATAPQGALGYALHGALHASFDAVAAADSADGGRASVHDAGGLPPLAGRRQGSLLVKPRGHWAQTDPLGTLQPAPAVVPSSSRPSSAASSGRSSRPGSASRRMESDPQWNGIRQVRYPASS